MSLQAKIEAVIYASEEPVTLQQLAGLLGVEAGEELDRMAAQQGSLLLEDLAEPQEQAAGSPGSETSETAPDPATDPGPTQDAAQTQDEALESEGRPEHSYAEVSPSLLLDDADKRRVRERERERAVRDHIRRAVETLMREYAESDRGIEIREVASGFRMATKPEYHDAVRGFVKSLKPALKLTLPALETLAVVAYKQPVTAAEISDIRGVDSAGVLGGLMARKLIATAGRKQVIGRPMLYKTTRDFLLRFGLKDVNELPSMDEFERMAGELVEQEDLPMEQAAALVEQVNARGDAEHIRQATPDENADPSHAPAPSSDVTESDDRDESTTGPNTTTQHATAETAAGGNDGRDNEPAETAPLYTTQAGEPAVEQANSAAGGQAATGAKEGERGSPA